MSGEFKEHGARLIANGYRIVPILPGAKRPALSNWQSSELGVEDLDRFSQCGVGVLTGQGQAPICALDIDTTDETLAEQFTAWCIDNLGLAPERTGRAPKSLLVYRALVSGWSKAASAWFEDFVGDRHRLEVLGKGQQFVAFHTHPETGKPYTWSSSLLDTPAESLPVITTEQVSAAIAEFERLAGECNFERVSGGASLSAGTGEGDVLLTYEPPVGLSREKLQALLDWANPDDYDEWLTVGMALHHETGGSEEGLELWDIWSSEANNYQGFEDLARRWSGLAVEEGRRPTTARTLIKWASQRKTEKEQTAQRQTRELIKARIAECEDSVSLLGPIALAVGEMAETRGLRTEAEGLLQARFKELTGVRPGIDKVRQAMRPAPVASGKLPRRQLTEMGNRDRMLDRYGDGLMFVPELGQWFGWTGSHWTRRSEAEVKSLAQETIRDLPEEVDSVPDNERESFFKFVAVSQRANMVKAMVELAQSDTRVMVPASELDKDRHLLGCANGAIDLTTGELRAPDPKHRITISTGVKYDPTAECPLFKQTSLEVFNGDAAMLAFVQRIVGYSLLGLPNEDVMVIPYGTGSNGKSTILGTVREALGDYAKMAGADTFLADGKGASAGGAREDVLRLAGSRFVYVSEPDEGSELREGLVKSMTGGEAIPARALYAKQTIEVQPSWVVFMPTNHRPIIKGDDWAIWRRLLPIPFTRNFDKDRGANKDPDRKEKLLAELPGVLRWCVEGALAYRREGLNPPDSIHKARESYRSDMDLLHDWLDSCCEIGPGYEATTADLWQSWQSWARENGELQYIRSSRALGRRLAQRFESVKKVQNSASSGEGRGFLGVKIREFAEFNEFG